MNKIPTHKISEILDSNNAFLVHVLGKEIRSNTSHTKQTKHFRAEYAHRDDYYIFFLVKQGSGRIMIDFEEYEFFPHTIHCIMPGQVHQPASYIDVSGWFLAVDSMLVKNEYKEIIERQSLSNRITEPTSEEFNELDAFLNIVEQRLNRSEQAIERTVLSDLISAYVGMVADIYRKNAPTSMNSRAAEITMQFKSQLAENYQTLKRPSQYAQRMNLSLVYLNEVVKKTIGLSVSQCIQNEIVLQAKRLLHYTNLNIKEISLRLGYEDWAYFSRLFTKVAGCPPSQFRQENLDSSNSNIH